MTEDFSKPRASTYEVDELASSPAVENSSCSAPVVEQPLTTTAMQRPASPFAQEPMFRIALTGGPCGGKTTCASVLSDRLQDLGWRVYRVPEAATVLLGGGANFYDLNSDQQYVFQKSLLELMLSLEDAFIKVCRASNQRAVIIFDRGAMDCSAYMPPEEWRRLCCELKTTDVELRDGRYDCVVNLVTAADGAEEFYSDVTNSVRLEDCQFARELDVNIREAWVGHPSLYVIDNSTSFSQKVSRVVEAVCNHIGERAPDLRKRKFLVETSPTDSDFPVKFQDYDVVHDYLVSQDGSQARLRKRGQYGTWTYTHTVRHPAAHGQRLELRRMLTGRDYSTLLAQRDPDRCTIFKRRRTFVYQNQYYQLDYFTKPSFDGLILLETYTKADGRVEVPNFLDVVKEVTDDKSFSMHNLAVKPSARKRLNERTEFNLMRRGLDLK